MRALPFLSLQGSDSLSLAQHFLHLQRIWPPDTPPFPTPTLPAATDRRGTTDARGSKVEKTSSLPDPLFNVWRLRRKQVVSAERRWHGMTSALRCPGDRTEGRGVNAAALVSGCWHLKPSYWLTQWISPASALLHLSLHTSPLQQIPATLGAGSQRQLLTPEDAGGCFQCQSQLRRIGTYGFKLCLCSKNSPS